MNSEHYREIRKVVFAVEGPNEDLVQEIAIKLAGQIDDIEGDPGAWIRSATRTMIRRYQPTRKMTGALPRSVGAGRVYAARFKNVELTEFHSSEDDSLERADVRLAVMSLPDVDKEIVLAHIWGSQTLEESGRRVGLNKWQTIRRWHNHILPKLRSELSEDSV